MNVMTDFRELLPYIQYSSNLVPSSLPTQLRHGGEIEILDLIFDIRLDMRMLFPYSAKLN